MSTQQASVPLYIPPEIISEEEAPFKGDLFARKQLAERLTSCIDRFPYGGVIAIDAPWGEGKSWFGQHWHKQLKTDGYRAAFINAFERDYVEEPFVMLVSEMLASLKPDEANKIKSSAIGVTKALAPLVVKGALNGLVRLTTGTTDFADKVDEVIEGAGEAAASAAEKFLAKQIEEYEKSKTAVDGFRAELRVIAAKESKPIVVFVDELDRCRPEFAVRLIERVKHLFEIKNVVFVLLLNQAQMSNAIRGVYGSETNAEQYLGKFFNLSLRLPKVRNRRHLSEGDNARYCQTLVSRSGFSSSQFNQYWAELMGMFSEKYSLSLRDLDRAQVLLNFSGQQNKLMPYLAWPITLKLMNPQLFSEILRGEKPAHKKAAAMLNPEDGYVSELFASLHTAHSNNFTGALEEKASNFLSELSWEFSYFNSKENFLPWLFNLVDLDTR